MFDEQNENGEGDGNRIRGTKRHIADDKEEVLCIQSRFRLSV